MSVPLQLLIGLVALFVLIFMCAFVEDWWNSRTSSYEYAVDDSDEWFVLLDDAAVAIVRNPEFAEMFWLTWEVNEIESQPIPDDLWDYANDTRRSFRHAKTGEVNEGAFPGGSKALESGRVLIRGLYRYCGNEQTANHSRNSGSV